MGGIEIAAGVVLVLGIVVSLSISWSRRKGRRRWTSGDGTDRASTGNPERDGDTGGDGGGGGD